eukprot:CAMPEP_0183739888 /NCGR_PEP_ID=MMETSP0737-20130205/58290_1 /TAXON_ID=385413 /ORGANISM="Thalassiosira miniscula, Strain CCMP1093" /LENGTH=249 /DNA_ID=CAMNT_0025974805 /DNA_START=459 /DNA_END=1208 /DNA_ORIENTATION=+
MIKQPHIIPIQIETERIPLDVMLYGFCGQTGKVEHIRQKRQMLMAAGNSPPPEYQRRKEADHDQIIYNNRLHTILGTGLLRINHYFCVDGDHGMSTDLQLATWVAAGIIVLLLFIIAAILSVLCIAGHAMIVIQRANRGSNDERNRFQTSCFVELLSDAIAWIVIMASLLYVALTWNERRGSHATLGSGCIVMLAISFAMFCGSIGLVSWEKALSRYVPALKTVFHECQRRIDSPVSSVGMKDTDKGLV